MVYWPLTILTTSYLIVIIFSSDMWLVHITHYASQRKVVNTYDAIYDHNWTKSSSYVLGARCRWTGGRRPCICDLATRATTHVFSGRFSSRKIPYSSHDLPLPPYLEVLRASKGEQLETQGPTILVAVEGNVSIRFTPT